MNLTQFEIIVSLAKTRNFTEAAESIGITQAAASYALSKIEAELGVALFERQHSGSTLTDVGAIVLQHAQDILIHVDSIREVAATARGLTDAKLRFGVVPTIPPHLLSGIIKSFQKRYPNTKISLLEGNDTDLREWLDAQLVDIVLVSSVDPFAEDTHTQLAKTQIKVVMPEDHLLANRPNVSFDDLVDETLIVLKTGSSTFSSDIATSGSIPLYPHYRISNIQTILTMVRDHIGISIMPDLVIADDREGLRVIDLDPSFEIYIGLMMAPTENTLQLTRLFATHAHEWAKNQGLF